MEQLSHEGRYIDLGENSLRNSVTWKEHSSTVFELEWAEGRGKVNGTA